MQNRHQPHQRSAHIDRGLHHVGPDHRRQAALKRIDDRQCSDDRNRRHLARPQRDRYHDRHRIHAHAFGRGPSQQKQSCSQRAQPSSEAPLNQFVRRVKIAAKVVRQQHEADDDAPHYVSHHDLKKREVRVVGEPGNADDGERAGLGRDDRERNRPPRNIASRQKIVAQRPLLLAESAAQTA